MVFKSLLPLAFAASCAASVLPQGLSTVEKSWLSLPISRRTETKPLRKRDQDVPLFNITSISYLVELSIGTPGQTVLVAIDTGSDELWVDPNCNDRSLSSSQESECTKDGTYVPASSSSAKELLTTNDIQYGKGYVELQYYTDNIALPASTINVTDVQFGVATATEDLNEGILGLGWGIGKNLQYENFIDVLASEGVTNSKAFSVALGDVDENNGGSLLFGAVDTKKFEGKLVSNPILGPQGNDALYRYWIQLDKIGFTQSGSSSKDYSDSSMAIVIDSGSSLSYLPKAVVADMVEDVSATWDATNQLYKVDCDLRDEQGMTFDFTFGDITIKVAMSEFLWEVAENYCFLGAVPVSTSSTVLLGDSFMRSAFIVFDQTQETISMAQYVNCGQDEQEIPKGGVGSITGACGSSSSSNSSGNSTDNDSAAGRTTFGTAGFVVAAAAGLMIAL